MDVDQRFATNGASTPEQPKVSTTRKTGTQPPQMETTGGTSSTILLWHGSKSIISSIGEPPKNLQRSRHLNPRCNKSHPSHLIDLEHSNCASAPTKRQQRGRRDLSEEAKKLGGTDFLVLAEGDSKLSMMDIYVSIYIYINMYTYIYIYIIIYKFKHMQIETIYFCTKTCSNRTCQRILDFVQLIGS